MNSGRLVRVPDPAPDLPLRKLPLLFHRARNLYVPSLSLSPPSLSTTSPSP